MDNNNWWKSGVEIFTAVSGWIAGPIIGALILGKYLDTRFDTKPWIFLGLTGLAFFISIFGIVKVVSKYMSRLEVEDPRQESGKKVEEDNKK
jgi:F0F1-type ATP synthase assembly protein I